MISPIQRRVVYFLLCLVFSLSVAVAGGILKRGNGAEPRSLDPQFISGDWENNVVGDMFMGLTTEDGAGNTIPGLAQSWKVSADGKVYTFTIRKGAKWSDGAPITAGDFVYAFKRLVNPKMATQFAYILYPVKNARGINQGQLDVEALGVKALDSSTLQITLENPNPVFLDKLVHFSTYALPKHVVEKYGKRWTERQNIVVSGAFILEKWQPQAYIRLRKNPLFFDAKHVALDGVIFYAIADLNAELKRFRAGDLDMTNSIPTGQFHRLQKMFGARLKHSQLAGTYFYVINKEKIKDIRVRKALSMAINRNVIVNNITRAGQTPAYSMVPLTVTNYVKGEERPHLPFKDIPYSQNLLAAKKLMREAGYGQDTPLEVELKYNTLESHKKIAVAIAAMWKKIGVKTRFFNQEASVHYESLRAGDFEIGRAGWIGFPNDPLDMLNVFLDTESNDSGWVDKNMEALLQKVKGTVAAGERATALAKIEQMGLNAYFYIPLYYYTYSRLVSDKVAGYTDNISDVHRSRFLHIK